MILRSWRGLAADEAAATAYARHLDGKVLPALCALPGFLGVELLQRPRDQGIEVLVQTRWVSMAAIEAFAGPDPGRAVVEPEVRAILAGFDGHVEHHELAFAAGPVTG